MSIETGFMKYVLYTPLTLVGFGSMYIFGGGILTFLYSVQYIFSGNFFVALVEYFVTSALPPTSISQVIFQVLVGTVVAGSKWYMAMRSR